MSDMKNTATEAQRHREASKVRRFLCVSVPLWLCFLGLAHAATGLHLDRGWQIAVTDFEGETVLAGERATVPKPVQPRVPASRVAAARGADGLVSLQFTNTWIAQLRWQGGPPLDLRAYLPHGTVSFDLDVVDLARGGMKFKLGCGPDCERKVPFLFAGRERAGRGLQRVTFALSCFWREGDDFSAVPRPFTLEGTGNGEIRISPPTFHRTGRPNTACPDYRTQSVTPEPLQESWAVEWWQPRHEAKLAEVRAHREAGRRVDLVFLGDSITQGWENEGRAAWATHFARHNAVALGFGGDRTENLLWRLQHGELDGMAPRAIVLLIGTNNTGERLEDPALTIAGIRANLDEIRRRQPQAKVLLLALFPRDEKPDGLLRRHNARINALLPSLADGQRVVFLDLGPALTQPDGTLSRDILPDWLHLSPAGYERWAQGLAPLLTQWLQP